MKKTLLKGFLSVSFLLTSVTQANDFDKVIKPFMKQYCVDCHDSDVQKGDVALHNINQITVENAALWKQVWEQVSLKEMPPRKKKKQPDLFKRLEV